MRLSHSQLLAGLTAVGRALTPSWEELSPWERSSLTATLSEWLTPTLVKLPEGVTAEEVEEGATHHLAFLESAHYFELAKLRQNPLHDHSSDGELFLLISPEAVVGSAHDLRLLTALFLAGASGAEPALEFGDLLRELALTLPSFSDSSHAKAPGLQRLPG